MGCNSSSVDSNENQKSSVRRGESSVATVGEGSPTRQSKAPHNIQEILDAHNAHRKAHDMPPLQWSDECYQLAKRQADVCEAAGELRHGSQEGPSGRHGQNGFAGSGYSAKEIIDVWYSEAPKYDFKDPGFKGGTGHFTQVVWKSTTHVGLAISKGANFAFANYYPAGNMQGRFPDNVFPKK